MFYYTMSRGLLFYRTPRCSFTYVMIQSKDQNKQKRARTKSKKLRNYKKTCYNSQWSNPIWNNQTQRHNNITPALLIKSAVWRGSFDARKQVLL